MKSMDKLTTGVAYGTSAGSAGYWFLQLLDKVTPSQWAMFHLLGENCAVLAVKLVDKTKCTERLPMSI